MRRKGYNPHDGPGKRTAREKPGAIPTLGQVSGRRVGFGFTVAPAGAELRWLWRRSSFDGARKRQAMSCGEAGDAATAAEKA
jgi:hypothetical protein